MVRKSNKTDHVLNLLSNGGKDKARDGNTEMPGPPVVPDENRKKEKQREIEASSVSIVQSSSEKKGLAETIKKSLEEELDKMIPEDGLEAEMVIDESKREVTIEEPDLEAVIQEQEEKIQEAVPESEEVIEETEPEAETQEAEFVFLNVMEALVKEKVLDYMKQFGNCTCPRCAADTSALALTQLPPKYVVINKEAVSPLMNFYTKKFAGQITVEITKACIRVGEVPHHNQN